MRKNQLQICFLSHDDSLCVTEFDTSRPDEVALDWLTWFPHDIVMLVEDA